MTSLRILCFSSCKKQSSSQLRQMSRAKQLRCKRNTAYNKSQPPAPLWRISYCAAPHPVAHYVLYVHSATTPSPQHSGRGTISLVLQRRKSKLCTDLVGQGCPGQEAEPGLKPRFLLPKPVLCHILGKTGT